MVEPAPGSWKMHQIITSRISAPAPQIGHGRPATQKPRDGDPRAKPGNGRKKQNQVRKRSARGPQEDWSKESFVRSIVLSPSFRVSTDQRCSNQ